MRRVGWVGCWLVTGGCLVRNPAYDDSESGTGAMSGAGVTTSGGASTTGTDATATGSGSLGGTATGESTAADTGTADTEALTGVVETAGATGSTGAGETTGVVPGVADIPADIATCVLRANANMGYGGPGECESLVPQELMQPPEQKDGMMVDLMWDDASGRQAWSYIRFDLSKAVPQGATITAAILVLTVSSAADQVFSVADTGIVRPAGAFDLATLAAGEPALGMAGVPIGATNGGDVKMLDVTAIVAPQAPLQHFAVEPQTENGRVFMNAASPAVPVLKVSWQ